jgi:phosphatidylinositol alpha-1,6-mannosyltransferase
MVRRPRVYLLTWDFPPSKGGIQRWMHELAVRLPDAELTVFAPTARGSRQFDRSLASRVIRLHGSSRGSVPWLFVLMLAVVWRSLVHRPDVIVCGHVVTAPAAMLVRAVLRIPCILFVHGVEIRGRRWRRPIDFALHHADLVLANSAFTRQCVIDRRVPADRVRILNPGVDPNRFAADHDPPVPTRASRSPMILSVSRLDEHYKGHDTMLHALPLVRAKCPDVRFVIVGNGVLLDYLKNLARSLAVLDSVEFVGEVADDQLPRYYHDCDVFVQLSREDRTGGVEGFGIVCLEAAAAGKPVVAGASGGLLSAVVDRETGLLVDPEDPTAIADAVVSLLKNAEYANRLGRAGRERVERELTWDVMAQSARRLVGEIVGEPRVAASASSS